MTLWDFWCELMHVFDTNNVISFCTRIMLKMSMNGQWLCISVLPHTNVHRRRKENGKCASYRWHLYAGRATIHGSTFVLYTWSNFQGIKNDSRSYYCLGIVWCSHKVLGVWSLRCNFVWALCPLYSIGLQYMSTSICYVCSYLWVSFPTTTTLIAFFTFHHSWTIAK